MRLLVRASTVRAPTITPPGRRVYALSFEGERDVARADDPEGGIAAVDLEGEAASAIILYFNNDVEAEADRGAPGIQALSREGETDVAAPSLTTPTSYAFNRIEVVERQSDLASGAFANHVVRGLLSGTWLKQSSISGGRIRHPQAYDLIFETLDATPVRLDHEIESYDGTAGELQVAVRLPSWVAQTDQFRCRIRYGADL